LYPPDAKKWALFLTHSVVMMASREQTVRTVHDDDGRGTGWLLERGPRACAAAVLVLSVVKYGIGLYPSWRYMQELARHWQHPLQAPLFSHVHARYLLDSPVSAEIAGIMHLTGAREYLAFHLVLACAAIVVPFCLRAVRQAAVLRLGVALLLVGGTVPALLLSWVGSYDPVSIGSAAVAALASNPVVRAAAWAVFAFNNAPEAAIALVIFAIVLWADGGKSTAPRIVLSGAGAVVGYVAIRVLTSVWGGGQSQLAMMKFYGFRHYLLSYGYLPLVVLSALGVGWLFLVDRQVRNLRAARALLVLALLAATGMPLLALDTSRTIATTLWPALLLTAGIIVDRLGAQSARALLARIAPAALILVVVVAWNTHLVYPGWRSGADVLLYLVGHHALPAS
jgi:hypothetical protein